MYCSNSWDQHPHLVSQNNPSNFKDLVRAIHQDQNSASWVEVQKFTTIDMKIKGKRGSMKQWAPTAVINTHILSLTKIPPIPKDLACIAQSIRISTLHHVLGPKNSQHKFTRNTKERGTMRHVVLHQLGSMHTSCLSPNTTIPFQRPHPLFAQYISITSCAIPSLSAALLHHVLRNKIHKESHEHEGKKRDNETFLHPPGLINIRILPLTTIHSLSKTLLT